ncbi:hypothetical protein [Clostridium felsineum]|uniref:Uncharacterized protein n=1 Tax=Clostridium felsineum TaxID=36839 RepID=A0A1S8L3C6_9CLOT|nr:hypothetical protein [Clostridium felsineum]URZ07539.1 hypothetical protein CLROS_028780 [Clostridium felsineum]URZ12570.1 hypothetical protein CROST_032930 [Clostridium felsineum]URZ15803.1 hypothetical protein CLFE_018500 [Clostridium felsineum DSM 794]
MFDISKINKRYWTVKINNMVLEVEPPKLKTLKNLLALSKSENEAVIDDLRNSIKGILDKNRKHQKVPYEIIEELDFDEMQQILNAYFDWLVKEKNSKN